MGIGLYVGNLIDKDDEFSDNILYKNYLIYYNEVNL